MLDRSLRWLGLAICLVGVVVLARALWVPLKAEIANVLIVRAAQRAIAEHQPVKPWPWFDHEVLGVLEFVERDLQLVVFDAASGTSLAFAPGWLPGSVLPGQFGNAVIAAHRDTHFRMLDELRLGERIIFHHVRTGDRPDADNPSEGKLEFLVEEIALVDSGQLALSRESARPRLVLVTCDLRSYIDTPSTWRLVAFAALREHGLGPAG
jgi:sortase (surface protein transpeptidase)